MSTVRMTPELIATMQAGVVFRIVEGGAPMGSKVTDVRIDPDGTITVDVDDGMDGDRMIVVERLHDLEP